MVISITKPSNVGNLTHVWMRKYAIIGRPMTVFIEVFFYNSSGTTLLRNEYSLSFKGESLKALSDYTPSGNLSDEWLFETLLAQPSSGGLVQLFKDDNKVYFCADATRVERIDFHVLNPGKLVDIKSIDEVGESSVIIMSPTPQSGISLNPTQISMTERSDSIVNSITTPITDSIVFHVVLHEGCWTKMTFVPQPSNQTNTISIYVGIFNIKGNIPENGTGLQNYLRVETDTSTVNLYPPTAAAFDTNWLAQINSDNAPAYYKIIALRYCEFDIYVKSKSNIDKVLTPAIHSFWNMGQFLNLGLRSFGIRGHVNKTRNTSGSGGVFQPVTVKIPTQSISFGCCDGLQVITTSNNSNAPYELRISSSIADSVNGESLVLDLDDDQTTDVNMSSLTHFDISGTYEYPLYGVKCNISKLAGSTNLQELRARYTSFYGNISNLQNLSALQKVLLNDCDVEGNISVFSNKTSITELTILNKDITGYLSSLSYLLNLSILNIANTSVEGDISALSNNTHLTELTAPVKTIFGDLFSLSGLTELMKLDLSGSDVSGDILHLGSLTKLQSLNLSKSSASDSVSGSVSGSVDNLTNIHFLSSIKLTNCDVSGDLSKLPVSCKEFLANGHTTPFTWTSTNPRNDRIVTINNDTLDVSAISIPKEIVMNTSGDVQNMLNDIKDSVPISNGSIVVRVNNLSDSELSALRRCCQELLYALGQVGISTLVLNGKPVTNDNQS